MCQKNAEKLEKDLMKRYLKKPPKARKTIEDINLLG